MIALGSVNWGSSPVIPIAFAYEKQRSGANMQYRVRVTVSSITGDSYFGFPIYLGLSINGSSVATVTLKDATPWRWDSAITYTSGWYTVSNKTSGTTPVAFRMYSGMGSTRDNTYSYSMAVDAAASTISVSNGTLATPLTIAVTRYNSGFTHTIAYTCGSVSGLVCDRSSSLSITWDTSNGNIWGLASQNTKGSSVNVKFTIITYNGNTQIGTYTSNPVSMAIPSSIKPTVALKVEDATEYLSTYGAFVQGWSKLKITATPSVAYGSPIKAYSISADGSTYTYNPVTTGVIKARNSLTVTAKVTDERERTSEPVSRSVTVLPYSKPSVSVIAYRCNSSGNADPEGAYMKVGFTASISSLNGKNSASYTIDYGSTPITGTGTSYTSSPIACDVSKVWSVEVKVSDKLDSTTRSAVIPVAFTLMDFYNTGKGVAFGRVATRNGFDCAMDAYFNGKRLQEVAAPSTDTDAVNLGYALANFAPAKEDPDHPGCYYRKVDGITEWINPPMELNKEYRTSERYMEKPVYVVMRDLGALPNNGSRTVPDLAMYVDRIVDAVFNTAKTDASYHNMREVSWYLGSYGTAYCAMTTTTDMSAYTARIKIKYTKTTN